MGPKYISYEFAQLEVQSGYVFIQKKPQWDLFLAKCVGLHSCLLLFCRNYLPYFVVIFLIKIRKEDLSLI